MRLALVLSIALGPHVARAQEVLVLSDGHPDRVQGALEEAGYLVTVAGLLESAYAGVPDPSSFCAVVHLNGETYTAGMPVAGQVALQDYVEAGGGFVGMEWNAYEVTMGTMASMPELMLFNRTNGHEGERQYSLTAEGRDHPVTAGLPESFSFSAGFSDGQCDVADDVAVLTREGAVGVASTSDGVCAREWGLGRIVVFNHAGNYGRERSLDYGTFDDADVRQLLAQAVEWSCGGGGGTGPRPVALAGEGYIVAEGIEVQLDGTGTIEDNSTLTYAWDLDGDGELDDSIEEDPVLSAASLDGPSTIRVALRVTSLTGRRSSISTANVDVLNVPPSAPTALSPKDGACLRDRAATLEVLVASDVPGDTLMYRFEVFQDEALNERVASVPVIAPEAAQEVSLLVELPAEPRRMYWRARAADDETAAGPYTAARAIRFDCGPDGGSDADVDADADTDGDADSDTDGDADSDTHGDTDSDTDGDADSDTDGDADSDSGSDSDTASGRAGGCCSASIASLGGADFVLVALSAVWTWRPRRRR